MSFTPAGRCSMSSTPVGALLMVGTFGDPQAEGSMAIFSSREAHDLVAWDVAHVLGESPAVAEGIDYLPVAATPEGVGEGVENSATLLRPDVPLRRAPRVADDDVGADLHGRIRWLSPNSCQRYPCSSAAS